VAGRHHGVGACLIDGFLHDLIVSFLVISGIILTDYI
jgi:hypothetical protein